MMNYDFWWRVRWLADGFHEWRSYEWRSLANLLTSDQKTLFTVTSVLIYFLHAILCAEHTIKLRKATIAHFAIATNDGLFWLMASPRLICDVTRTRCTGSVTSYRRLFLHAQVGAKAIFTYTIVWFLRAPRWYIGPTAMPRAAVTPIAPERSEGAIGCDSRPRHCRRDDIPAWRPNKITLLSLLPRDLTMYHRFISFLRAVQFREGR